MFRSFAIALTLGTALSLARADTAPDAFVMSLSTEVIDAVKADKAIQAGDVGKIRALVDTKVLPNVNLQRMVIKSVGQPWRSASPEQQKRLTEEFKTYLINTYAGALTQVRDVFARCDTGANKGKNAAQVKSTIADVTRQMRASCKP